MQPGEGLPLLVLSGRAGELDRGADDYIVKPFSYPELHSRVAALLRRAAASSPAFG